MIDVTVLTCPKYLHRDGSQYVDNIFKEYHLLRDALEANNLSVQRISWDNETFDFTQTRAVVFRTIWDYFERFDEFFAFLETIHPKTTLINPCSLIEWNINKHYLLDLEEQNIDIVPTAYIAKGEQKRLKDICIDNGWQTVVVKPAISGGAYLTYKVLPEEISDFESTFSTLCSEREMLVQPFLRTISTRGEASLMVMNGKFSHAVIKQAKTGDFRVQDDFGGSVQAYEPSSTEIEFAERVFAACHTIPAYGRADIVWGDDGTVLLGELEVIEPELWMRFSPEAADEMAKGILRYLH